MRCASERWTHYWRRVRTIERLVCELMKLKLTIDDNEPIVSKDISDGNNDLSELSEFQLSVLEAIDDVVKAKSKRIVLEWVGQQGDKS
jgi:hypothetical protein